MGFFAFATPRLRMTIRQPMLDGVLRWQIRLHSLFQVLQTFSGSTIQLQTTWCGAVTSIDRFARVISTNSFDALFLRRASRMSPAAKLI